MKSTKTKLQVAEDNMISENKKIVKKIETLGKFASLLNSNINELQRVFDCIRNVPNEKRIQLENVEVVRLNWLDQAKKIEIYYKNIVRKVMINSVSGVSAGVATAALGPSAAMGIATSYGVASTGTTISALSGAAATNASLAWLGGGSLAAGGGGIFAGKAFLALAGPIGWAISGVSLLTGGILFVKSKNDRKRLEDIYISISNRETKLAQLAIVELNKRILKIVEEDLLLEKVISEVKGFGTDYELMSEHQQYNLITFVNLMNTAIQLLVEPILAMQPKFSDKELQDFMGENEIYQSTNNTYKLHLIYSYLANLLYNIQLDDKDKKLIWKSLKQNNDFIKAMGISKNEFKFDIIDDVISFLNTKN